MKRDKTKLEDTQIERIAFDILLDIKSYCDENDVRYYLTCGTLLGVVRHSGFISWNDATDIMMVRSDYEMFLNTYNVKINYVILKMEKSFIMLKC